MRPVWSSLQYGISLVVLALLPAHSARTAPLHRAVSATATPVPGAPITLDALQAKEVAVLEEFIHAYNAGHVGAALALFGRRPGWSDCDYRQGRVIYGLGHASLQRWLEQRAADHDHLDIGSIEVGTVQENALGVTFQRRQSDTLRALGQPHGIMSFLSAKVLFDPRVGGASDPPIGRFANGPYGGSQEYCRLHPS